MNQMYTPTYLKYDQNELVLQPVHRTGVSANAVVSLPMETSPIAGIEFPTRQLYVNSKADQLNVKQTKVVMSRDRSRSHRRRHR